LEYRKDRKDGTIIWMQTFDLSLSKTLTRHDYFNLSDDAIFRDHEPIMTEHVPCTDGSHFYYLEKKLSFTKQEEVKKRATQAAKKKKPFLFHWRGGYLTREILKELLIGIEEAAKEKASEILRQDSTSLYDNL